MIAMTTLVQVGLGQIGNAVVTGRVSDTSGAVIVGAEVQIKRVSTNEIFRATTTASGDYNVVSLPIDVYEIRVTMAGFKTEVRTGIKLEVGSTNRFDFELSVGEVTQTVEVSAEAPILRTENSTFGQVIDNKKIDTLPLNTRNVLGTLGGLTPGVAPGRGQGTEGGRLSFNVRGMRKSDNLLMVDGTMMSEGNGASTHDHNPDAVQEFEVKTGLYGAEYGVRPGGQFSLITKSGTNQLHGTLFEFLRNDNLDARNFFAPKKQEFKRNQFGGVVGGPVYIPKLVNGKDKMWFFFAYQGERIRQFTPLTGVMPTVDQKAGRFATTIIDPLTGQPFANNTIPSSRFNPVALKFLPFWPDPNTAGAINYTSTNSNANSDRDQIIVKFDFKFSERNRWSGRFLYDTSPINFAYVIDIFRRTDPLKTWGQNITNTRVIGNNIVNDFGVHFYRRPYFPGAGRSQTPDNFGASLGIPNFPKYPADVDGVVPLTVTGYTALGDRSLLGPVNIGNWEVRDQVAFNVKSHSLKAGYHYREHYNLFALTNRSAFNFQTRFTGNAFADFLLGYPTSTAQGGETLRGNFKQNSSYFFVQDDWKASQKLTVNLGLRYEYRFPWNDKRGFMSNFDPTTLALDPPEIQQPLQPWETGRFVANEPLLKWKNLGGFLPRVGLAYRVSSKLVVRTGFGAFSNEPVVGMVQQLGANPRTNATAVTYQSGLTTPTISLSDPFNPTQATPGGALPNVNGFENPTPLWLIYSWGTSIQYEISPMMAFETAYQGGHSIHESTVTEFNDAVPGATPRQQRRPFPQLQSYRLVTANGDSKYNALEAKLQRRPGSSGLSMLLTYTWAKAIDTVGSRLGVVGDPGSISRNVSLLANRGRGDADIPHRFAGTVGYETPFGKGKPYLTDNFMGKVLGGWSLNGILTFQGGAWVTPLIPTDRLDVGSTASSRPDVVRDPNLSSSERVRTRWFDTTALALPAAFTYGNAGRAIIEGPGLGQLDFGLLRNFTTSESTRIEFRYELFNATNHTNFNIPGLNFGTADFGVIGSAQPARSMQFGLKFYF
jgi:hypothetical protein